MATGLASPTVVDGVQWVVKPVQWFDDVVASQSLYGLWSLSPQQVLDDAARHPSSDWEPDFDDIDMDDVKDNS